MRGQMAAIGPALLDGCLLDDRVGRLGLDILDAEARRDVLQRQVQLIVAELLGRAPEARAAQRPQNVRKALGLLPSGAHSRQRAPPSPPRACTSTPRGLQSRSRAAPSP